MPNEKKYIDADLLKNAILTNSMSKKYPDSIQDVVDNIPAADVAEVRHGVWSDKMMAYKTESDYNSDDVHFGYKCSICGGLYNKTNFCGGCGARMDGEPR